MKKKFPNKVYKFRKWDLDSNSSEFLNSKRIISDKTVYFASPSEFNDPFDIDIVPNYLLLSKDDWERKLQGLLEYGKRVGWNSEQHLNERIQKLLIGDPIPIWDNKYELQELGFKMLRSYQVNGGIFSASPNKSNILMWSHYADNHNGISFGFDTSDFQKDTSSNCGYVIYTDELRKPDIKPDIDERLTDVFKLFNFKAPFWSYEDEFRFFLLIIEGRSRVNSFDPKTLKEVIFGEKMEMNMKRRTYEFIKGFREFNHLEFYSAHKKPGYFDLTIKPFDINKNY